MKYDKFTVQTALGLEYRQYFMINTMTNTALLAHNMFGCQCGPIRRTAIPIFLMSRNIRQSGI